MNRLVKIVPVIIIVSLLGILVINSFADKGAHVMASNPVEAGKYLVSIAGCDDCHSPGWMEHPGSTPEALRLTGVPLGWQGPWGTSYGANLRLVAQKYDETGWVQRLRTLEFKPPMPGYVFKNMSDSDLRAMYQYLKSMGAAGEEAPAWVPPGQEPKTPYLVMFPPKFPEGMQPMMKQ